MIAKLKTRPNFSTHDTAAIGISINSRNHEGFALESIIDWVNSQPTFNKCVIDLSDTLHRHNFNIDDYSLDQSHDLAYRCGEKWIEDNQPILQKLRMPFEIIRWDTWLKSNEFIRNKVMIECAITYDRNFRSALNYDVECFASRQYRAGISRDKIDKMLEGSYAYLIEELAVHSIFFDKIQSVSVYPGRQQKSFKLMRKGLVSNVPKGMQKSDYAGLYINHQEFEYAQAA